MLYAQLQSGRISTPAKGGADSTGGKVARSGQTVVSVIVIAQLDIFGVNQGALAQNMIYANGPLLGARVGSSADRAGLGVGQLGFVVAEGVTAAQRPGVVALMGSEVVIGMLIRETNTEGIRLVAHTQLAGLFLLVDAGNADSTERAGTAAAKVMEAPRSRSSQQ